MEQPTRMLESDSRLRPRARELRNNATKQENDRAFLNLNC